MFTDENDITNVLNYFFRDQTLLDDHFAPIPNIEPYPYSTISSLVITLTEVESVMKCLQLGKPVCPAGRKIKSFGNVQVNSNNHYVL